MHRRYFFFQFCQLFHFCPHAKMLDMPKWFSDCESVNSLVSVNISRDCYSRAETFKRTEKINKIGDQQTLFMFILRLVIKLLFCFQLIPFLENRLFSIHITNVTRQTFEKRSCMSVWVCFAPTMPNVGSRYTKLRFEKKQQLHLVLKTKLLR